MSYLRYLCVFAHSGVQRTLCCVDVYFSSFCVPFVVSVSGLSIFDCPFGVLKCLFSSRISFRDM
jgi:hypothetical protein